MQRRIIISNQEIAIITVTETTVDLWMGSIHGEGDAIEAVLDLQPEEKQHGT